MSLSLTSRRRYQTTSTTTTRPSSSSKTTTISSSSSLSSSTVRKQNSLIEVSSSSHAHCNLGRYSAQQRGYLSRGLSVGRSIENIRQKLYASSPAPIVGHLSRQTSLAIEESAKSTSRFAGRLTASQASQELGVRLRDKSLVAWASTSSLKGSQPQEPKADQNESDNAKADKNRINLNIVLAQTIRATNEQETVHSDPDESSDLTKEQQPLATATSSSSSSSSSSSTLTPTPTEENVTSALTVQRRPPLVRAMSAPVRLDESSKSSVLAGKRSQQKLRRRKIFTRATSTSVASVPIIDGGSSLLSQSDASSSSSSNNNNNNKKSLSRARSVIAPDVITLVSLLSSEGSDSEREDNSSSAHSTPTGNEKKQLTSSSSSSHRSPQRRAPLLRKTGKSVSFQDSYPPTFQLASKEYSHMIRRGSIAPLAARIRANRPPTAPPVSIFLAEPGSKAGNQMETRQQRDASSSSPSEEAKKENNASNCNVQQEQQQQRQQQQEYNFPNYVCSIKERECWKLHQKMCAKGVNVSYDTVLRGMLTPTEFRHFQKQREDEEIKAQEAAEAEAEAAATAEKDAKKTPATAVERLSESLLQRE